MRRNDFMESLVFEYLYTVEGYITFTVRVQSGEFSGASSLCMPKSSFQDAISSLNDMYNNLKGTYQINDCDSDDFIQFEFLDLGHIKVSGQVGGSHREQFLNYQFVTDQTVLNSIISDFKRMAS